MWCKGKHGCLGYRRTRFKSSLPDNALDNKSSALYTVLMNGYTQEQVEVAAREAGSIKEFLELLGLKANSGQYRRAKHIAAHYGVDLPKYDTKAGSQKALAKIKIPNDIFFSKGVQRQGPRLRRRLIEDFGWEDKCMIDGCPSPEPVWNNMVLVLQVDHIDGDDSNNEITNLRFVCPNCHTQTNTYSNKKRSVAQ